MQEFAKPPTEEEETARCEHKEMLLKLARSGSRRASSVELLGQEVVERKLCWYCGLLLERGVKLEKHLSSCSFRPGREP